MRWSLSYRVRAIVLVALLAGAAVAATGLTSARSTAIQVSASVDAQQSDLNAIADALRQYGVVHGGWTGVAHLALRLERQTSQRIRLVTQTGDEVIADTDNLHGRAARQTSDRSPAAIVPRPRVEFGDVNISSAYHETTNAMANYRSTVHMAACLTQASINVTVHGSVDGIPRIRYDTDSARAAGCREHDPSTANTVADESAAKRCIPEAKGTPDPMQSSPARPGPNAVSAAAETCLDSVFQTRMATITAVPLLLYTGFRGASVVHIDFDRIAVAAIPILLVAIVCAAVLSRHVLRPVDAVIRASRLIEDGHRTARVPERGNDEMTALARAFNRMADSVAISENRQRQLAADVAHELRTPLANIRGYLEALTDGVLAPTTNVFESLHEEALLQQRIIDDLQDLALADRHQLIGTPMRTDIGELTRTAGAAHAARADSGRVALTVEAHDGLYAAVDPDRLRQAMGNLLSNALRATEPGGSITITARRAGPVAIQVDVVDTGHGIRPEHLPYIFDRFWRADPSRTRDSGGSGLGLAITREIIHGHGGTLRATSRPATGSTFTIVLPAEG